MTTADSAPTSTPEATRLPALPQSAPTLVLLGSEDSNVVADLDRLAATVASTLDVRTGVLWTEVPDGLAFLDAALREVASHRRSVRFAFARPDSTQEDLIRRALVAPTLEQLANARERAHLSAHPPIYEVRYQPVISLQDGAVIGFESLIRAHADEVRVDAEELIARAGRGGWINDLDKLGRTLAVKGIGPWLGDGLLFLNVMAPGGAFDTEAVLETIHAAMAAGIDPDQLVLEAVERNRYTDLDQAAEQIESLRATGVRIAVDDVGDGFASLRVVSAFKPDVIKIAGQLVSDLPSPEARAVVSAITRFAHETDAWVVAENIETAEQAHHLTAMGVDWGQGLFLGAPSTRSRTGL